VERKREEMIEERKPAAGIYKHSDVGIYQLHTAVIGQQLVL